jgi:putative methyltransferase (TIGR04325 family)
MAEACVSPSTGESRSDCERHSGSPARQARAWSRVLRRAARLIRYNSSMWSGRYRDWEAAARACRKISLEGQRRACEWALGEVLAGRALFERDSLLQHQPITCWPLMLALCDLQARGTPQPTVLDYGGGLGSVYFQHRAWYAADRLVTWNVVELPEIAATGQRLVQDSQLRFFGSLEEAVHQKPPDLILAAGIMPMVPSPEALLDTLASLGASWVFLDRIPVTHRLGQTLITRQVVPRTIYEHESPFWFFDETSLLQMLSTRFRIVGASLSDFDDPVWVEGNHYQWRGYLCAPKSHHDESCVLHTL